MLHVHYSNSTNILADELLKSLESSPSNLFTPSQFVIVPNRRAGTILRTQQAFRTGFAGNIPMDTLEQFATTHTHPHGPFLTRAYLTTQCYAALSKELKNETWGTPFVQYAKDDRHRAQLAQRMAKLYWTYLQDRPEWFEAWKERPTDEHWQHAFWFHLSRSKGQRREYFTTPSLYFAKNGASKPLPPHVHLFGLSHLRRSQMAVIHRLAQEVDVYVYALNPCREYWEDLTENTTSSLLYQYGPLFRSTVRFLNEESHYQFQETFSQSPPQNLLQTIQTDLLSGGTPANVPSDSSIQIAAAPTPRREIEHIAEEIGRIRANNSPRFEEHIIYVPPSALETYAPLFQLVLTEYQIPHHIVDVPMRSEAARVAKLLLSVPLSGLSRKTFLDALGSSLFLDQVGIENVERNWFSKWSIDLGILGEERTGTPHVYSWKHGRTRLAAAAFLGSPKEGLWNKRDYAAPFSLRTDQMQAAHLFIGATRALSEQGAAIGKKVLTYAQWRTQLTHYMSQFCSPHGEVVSLVHSVLSEYAGFTTPPISYQGLYELLIKNLDARPGTMGRFPVHGVRIAPIGAMGNETFANTFLCGLSHKGFPDHSSSPLEDLRLHKPLPSDVFPPSKARHGLLEIILNTRSRLHLSYVSEGDSGEAIHPSVLLLELQETLHRYTQKRYPVRAIRRHAFTEQEESYSEQKRALQKTTWTPPPSRPPAPLPPIPGQVSLSQLFLFIESPHQAWAKQVLGMHQRSFDEEINQTEELFDLDAKSTAILRRTLFSHVLHSPTPITNIPTLLADYTQKLVLQGSIVAPLLPAQLKRLGESIAGVMEELSDMEYPTLQTVFGESNRTFTPSRALPPIQLTPETTLIGKTTLFMGPSGLLSVSNRTSRRGKLRTAFEYMALTASDALRDIPRQIIFVDNQVGTTWRPPPISSEEAKAYFELLIRDFYEHPHDYLFSGSKSLKTKNWKADYHQSPEKLLGFGPISSPRGLSIPTEVLDELRQRRIGPLERVMK